MEWIWIGIIISLVLTELMSLNFTSICFVFSSLISLVLFYTKQNYIVQVSAFLIIGLGIIIIIRPKIIDKIISKRDKFINKVIIKYPFSKRFFPNDIIMKLTNNKSSKDKNRKSSQKVKKK